MRSSTLLRLAPARLHLSTAVALWLAACAGATAHGGAARISAASPPKRDAYVEALIAHARRAGLAQDPEWHKLLHYRLGIFGRGFLGGGYTSEADGAGFFLSPHGKIDPQAELDATIRAMFGPLPAHAVRATRHGGIERGPDAHPVCQFPARLAFLYRKLQLDVARLPVTSCPMLEQFLAELNAESVTLVFSAYYLNNPASAFGHTFLRFNRASTATGQRRELLDYGIDYSADVDTGNAVIYALKGLTGLFPGTFKRIPYFYKVREYNDYESRDLWEYDLAFAPEQLARLAAHLWELGHTYFDYYYLSENCSYHILSLLEVANPELDLMSQLASPVIPADTVKALYHNPGLVRRVHYRPSLRKQLQARVRQLNDSERELVEQLAYDTESRIPSQLDDRHKILVLDAAADLVDVQYAKQLVDKSDREAARKKQRILERRAQILHPSPPLEITTPWQDAPEHGHGSRRVGFGVAAAGREPGATAEFRLALHDLADPAAGYLELSSIEFLRARLQIWPSGRFELDDGSVFKVMSLTPQSRFERRLSWAFDLGATTIDDSGCNRCLAGQIAGGIGPTFAIWDTRVALFVLAEAAALGSPALLGLVHSHLRLGLGPSGGLRVRLQPKLIALVTGRWLWLPAQAPHETYRIDAVLRWQYLDALATGIEGRLTPNGIEGQLLSFVYF